MPHFKQRQQLLGASLFTVLASVSHAAEVRVLSAGAVEPGLHAFAQQQKRDTGHELKIQFNTAPQIAKRLEAGEAYDILIAPPPVIDRAAAEGKVLADTRVPVGRVGVGVIVRRGQPAPNIATVDALKQAVLGTASVVYNTASTGLYLDRLFAKMGVLEQLKAKSTRYPDGASVMEYVIKGKGDEIGFGATTEIKLYEPKGLSMVGALPAEVQNYTNYEAVLMSGAAAADAAREVLRHFATSAGKAAVVSGGVE